MSASSQSERTILHVEHQRDVINVKRSGERLNMGTGRS